MPAVDFLPLDPRTINVRTFDCGKEAINVYLHRYAAKNMALNLNRTFVLPYAAEDNSEKSQVAAYYTLAHQTLVREELPDPSRLPRYPAPVILLAQLGIDQRLHRQSLRSLPNSRVESTPAAISAGTFTNGDQPSGPDEDVRKLRAKSGLQDRERAKTRRGSP